MPAESPRVCVVILNVTGLPILEDCLLSLGKAEYPGLEIILVHNGPRSEGLEAGAKALCRKVAEVIFTGADLGFAAGNNPGIRAALARGAEYVLLLNDDTIVSPGFLGPLVEAMRNDSSVGMAGPRIFYHSAPGRIWFSGAKFDPVKCSFSYPRADQDEDLSGSPMVEEADYVTACAVLVSRRLLETTGLLDERFFLYWEDCDWGLRARASGFRLLVVPASKIWHKVSVSSGGNDSPAKLYYKTRSHLLFSRRYCSGSFPGLLLRLLRDAAWLLFKSGKVSNFKMAAALVAGVLSYFAGGRGSGPRWLAEKKRL